MRLPERWRSRLSAVIRDPQLMWIVALVAWPAFLTWAAIDYAHDRWWVVAGIIGTTLDFAIGLDAMRFFLALSGLGEARRVTYKTKPVSRTALIPFYSFQAVAATLFVVAIVVSTSNSNLGQACFRIAGALQLLLVGWSSLVVAARRVAPVHGGLKRRQKLKGAAWAGVFLASSAGIVHGFGLI